MNLLTRRSVIAGSAAAVTAVPAVAFSARSALATSATEDPKLLDLGRQIDPLLTAYREAVKRKQAARAMAEALCPALPDELVVKNRPMWSGCFEDERDLEGTRVYPPNYVGADGKTYARHARAILESDLLKEAIVLGRFYASRRTKFGRDVYEKIEIAKRYETKRKAAIKRSGLSKAREDLYYAALSVYRLVREVQAITPVTVAGVLVWARALTAGQEVEDADNHVYPGSTAQYLGGELADACLRIVGNQSAAA